MTQDATDTGSRPGVTSDERKELAELRLGDLDARQVVGDPGRYSLVVVRQRPPCLPVAVAAMRPPASTIEPMNTSVR